MKTKSSSSKMKLLSLVIVFIVMMFAGYVGYIHFVYQSMGVIVSKSAVVEYGSANYNIKNIVQKVEGKIISVKKDIDTTKVGEQEVIVEVKKAGIVKEIPITVSVIDTVAPEIKIKEDTVTITQVNDVVTGAIQFSENGLGENTNSYSIEHDDLSEVGSHEITITAKDQYGNISKKTFVLEVNAPPVVEPVYTAPAYSAPVYNNLAPNAAGGDMVSIAYSLVGAPYVYGTNGPYTFDCSGFVQYVYSLVGISVSRSSYTQYYYDGYNVPYEQAQPGDILSWGAYDGAPSHSALYVGNGLMIHAANPSTGVIVSDVAAWTRGSGTRVIAVKRIQ